MKAFQDTGIRIEGRDYIPKREATVKRLKNLTFLFVPITLQAAHHIG
jgi:hypothetical protein